MARFYGTVKGGRGTATRLGHESTGLQTIAASYSGAVSTTLYVDQAGRDCCRIELVQWASSGTFKLIYDGPVGGPEAAPNVRAPVAQRVGG